MLFLQKLCFKYETLVGVPSHLIVDFNKRDHDLKENKDYKYILRENTYIEARRNIDDKLKEDNEFAIIL